MKRKGFRYRKQMILALLVIAAGLLYCLAVPKGEPLSKAYGTEEEEPADTGTICDEAEVPPETEPPDCYVYVCGEVLNAGVYVLKEGQRLYEAVDLAGGFTENAAPEALNLVLPVSDGMKIDVPDKERAAAMPAVGFVSGSEAVQGEKININTATREQLMTLNGIGAARADAIITYREEHGAFSAVEDIMQVSGIKDAAFAKIKDHIVVR